MIKNQVIKTGKYVLAAAAVMGAFMFPARTQAAGDWNSAKQAVINAYKNYQTEVEVGDYNLNYETEYSQLKSMMNEVVSETPYLFYTGTRFSVSRNTSTNQIVKITLGYADDYKNADGSIKKKKIKNTRVKLDAAIDAAMSEVQPSMNKLEKAMVLHDYIISNTSYTKDSSTQSRVTEIGVFLKHKANCEGYSRAYAILLGKAGIPVKFVSSDKMVHMWNQIKIGKDWYHVDVTWDDPLDAYDGQDQYGRVSHENFLCSTDAIQKTGHEGFSAMDSSNTKYDKKYWRTVSGSFYYRDRKWLYMTKKGVTERDKLAGGKSTVLFNVSGSNLIRHDKDQYYYIAYNSIFLYNYTTNEAKTVWKASTVYQDGCTLDQIKYAGGKISYRVLDGSEHISNSLSVKTDGTV